MHPFSLRAAAPALPFAFLALALPAQGWVAGPSVATTGNAPRQGGYLVIAPAGTYLLGGLPTLGSGDAPVDKFTGSAWVASTPLESSFENGDAAVDELGRILVIAGVDAGGGLGDSYVWDEQNGNNGGIDDRSNQAPDQGFVCANDDQGRVLSIGGSAPNNFAVADGSGRVERYDANQNAWTVLAPMPTPVADAAACNDGIGHILVFGGYDTGGQRTANVASYDLSTGAWSDTAIPDLPIALAGAEAVLGNDGLVYVIGGSDTNGPLATVHRVDPVSGAWGTAPSMLEPRENFGCAIDAAGYIHVVGGSASQTSETMFTSTCPTIVGAPGARPGFVGLVASLDVVVGGSPPFTYQWRRDGVPLTDGATSYGSVLAGSSSASLTFRGVTPGDAGHAYDCVITNACGSATSPPGTLLLTDPLPLPSAFVVRSLPGGSTGSAAYSIDGDVVVGQTNYVHSQYGTLSRPAKWDVVTGAYSDLTPAGSVGGLARCVRNGAIVGWWWWPYTVQAGTGYNQHAAQWSTAGPFFEMQYSGWEFGSISDTDGQHHAGGCRFDEMSTNSHGFVWTGTSRSGRNLTPSPAWGSGASAIDGDDVFGWVHVGYGVVHAAAWFGPTHDYVDLQPAVTGSGRSYVYDAEAGMQIGAVYFGNNPQPCLWAGTAASYTELTIAGATLAVDRLRDGLLLGSLAQNGSSGPAVFRHGVAEWVELQQFVPPWYGPAVARDLYRDPQSGALTIVGSATNLNTGRPEALVWQSAKVAPTAARLGRPCPVTIRFTPDGSGGYDVARTVPQWFDDSALGTEIAAGGLLPADTMSPAQALGFAFTMPGGGSTTAVHVDDNGRVVADPAATSSSSPIPGTMRLGPAVIAPYWTDLDSAGGSVRFHADPQAGFATITWRDVPQAGAANALTFQLRLESDGSFAFTYLDARDWQQPAGNYTNNVVVGCSGGNGVADPGASDFAVYPIASGGSSMVYQTWTATNAPQHVDLQAHLHLTRFGVIGGALEFELGGLTSVSAAAFLVLGLQDPGIEFTALLTGIPGLTGCVQHASPDLVTLMLLNGGTATGSFAIPASPSLVGLPLQAQTAAVAPGESLLGVVLSDALRVTIGG